ncbi:hypothetical protein BDF14DRAFT_1779377 [Spinellus fusiger]|nr:hypothetical protein BDF14DRAFT_1779377 [Spinellus fusiger]
MNTDVCLMKDFNIGINPTEETVPGNTSAQPLETSPVDPIIEDEDDDEDIQYEEATEEVDQKEPKEDEKNEVEHGTESPTPLPSADLPLSKIVDGDACAANGQNKCVDLNNSGDWATCNFNKWVIRPCAPGLVCHEAAGSVYCDVRNSALRMINWSNSESLSKDENNLESQHFVIASAVDSI